MKVRPKRIHALEDCFDATEGQHKLRITRMGHRMIVQASDGFVNWDSEEEMSGVFALRLQDVVEALLQWRLKNPRP